MALAHLIMGDGSAWAYTLLICTDSYTIPDAVRLINVLIVRYELDCSLRFYRPNQPRIHIKPYAKIESNSNTFYVWINDV